MEAKGAIPHFLKNHPFSIFQLDIIRALVERPKVGRAADTVLVDLRMVLSWRVLFLSVQGWHEDNHLFRVVGVDRASPLGLNCPSLAEPKSLEYLKFDVWKFSGAWSLGFGA